MPKQKTKSGAKKRFKMTGTGKIKRKSAFKNHILTKKETKQKRRLSQKSVVSSADERNIKLMFPYGI
jgi:large subunit ribosomal protein L35